MGGQTEKRLRRLMTGRLKIYLKKCKDVVWQAFNFSVFVHKTIFSFTIPSA
ncbi:hypothetical protein l11_04010 [Neisseria weaveri LMG 5135]|nr:hypothetical protein l13_11810 [Neisseria weaveri ATCC 51223]EGV38599.1 hypothetical protein l11_04010 [Neisseria weaveri LMG 5135]